LTNYKEMQIPKEPCPVAVENPVSQGGRQFEPVRLPVLPGMHMGIKHQLPFFKACSVGTAT